jgi:arginine utilization protein RocB
MTERHLQPFNPLPKAIDGCQFPSFTRLHKELRVYIWESLLHHERFIQVRLDPDPENGQQRHIGDDGRYTMTVKSRRVMSKLFHICGESRDVAMQFYSE